MTDDPLATFAPLVSLHPRESWLPMSASRFLRYSTLEWSGGPCPLEVNLAAGAVARRATGEQAPALVARRLGDRRRPYRHRPRGDDCLRRRDAIYATTQHTRPFGIGDRPRGLRPDEGFNLDLLRDAYPGEQRALRRGSQLLLERVPAYADREPVRLAGGVPGLRLTYWLLFGVGQGHEGTWIRIDVLVRRASEPGRYVPVSATYFGDGDLERVHQWEDVERDTTHPIVYSALGSHLPYARSSRSVRCATCPLWRTWAELRDVRREPWYGYRGGWGVRGSSAGDSGPPGPS